MGSLINDDYPIQLSSAPIIDFSILLNQDSRIKSEVIKEIGKACQDFGFFNIINHGIGESLIEDVMDANSRFFDMPIEQKKELRSNDVYKPVRFETFIQDDKENGKLTREFLKLYAHPIGDWIGSWPGNPPDYSQVCGAIMESLSLSSTFWQNKIEQGMQMMGINCYESACLLNNIWTGIAPHTDHTIITLLVQSSPGLQVMNPSDGCWNAAPGPKGSLHVLVGDHLQVLSNGKYKSVIHRAVPGSEERRLSVASFHSFAMDEVVEPAMELVDREHPNYKGSSVRDYLNYLSSKESKPFLETLKIVS
ncbi:hypothetical protein GH714_043553 [Hevea brasiliensis]|uniref:Fe2OG dioxygenase domain-containing protein n=1 Tax=Hevea brasiliensis TaxID=3981 RepID=A0A6A6K2Q4_HEVBR|nr:hypothetical protein GH714_043553 [Hevea brasiliensis]